MINSKHFKDYVIEPALSALAAYDPRLNTPESVDLMLGTAAQETDLGYWFAQVGGPGLGPYSVELDTEKDIWRYLNRHDKRDLKDIVLGSLPIDAYIIEDGIVTVTDSNQLVTNLTYTTYIARIKYWMVPDPMPQTLEGRASYWKKFYNTEAGHGTEAQYMDSYRMFVARD